MARHGRRARTAAAPLGALNFGLAGLTSSIACAIGTASVAPMGLVRGLTETLAVVFSELAAGADDSGGAVFVPALNGLGAPWWEPAAVGTLTGLTATTTRAQVARAGLEAVAHQICDVLDVMDPAGELELLHAGGGATSSALLMQLQANLLNRELLVAAVADISPLGAGALAAHGLGIEPRPALRGSRHFLPDLAFTQERRERERERWRDALVRAGVRRVAG